MEYLSIIGLLVFIGINLFADKLEPSRLRAKLTDEDGDGN